MSTSDSTPLPDFIPESDEELYDIIRDITGYGDSVDKAVLESQIRIAKLRLYNRTGKDDFYDNASLTQALLGYTGMLTKSTVENTTLESYEIGDESVQFGNVNSNNPIMDLWAEMVAEALGDIDSASDNMGMSNSSSFISGEPRDEYANSYFQKRYGHSHTHW